MRSIRAQSPVVLLKLILLLTTSTGIYGQDERFVLNRLFTTAAGENWKENDGWGTDSPICSWYGVTCKDGETDKSVTGLDLRNNNLIGRIPKILWSSLTSLESATFKENSIADAGFEGFGEAVSKLPPIKLINFAENSLVAATGIGDAPDSLQELHLTQNRINAFPEEIVQLKGIATLFLSFNVMKGTIPTQIGTMTSLENFYCFGNDLTGTVPSEIGQLSKMQTFTLAENALTGTIPRQVSNMWNLRTFSVHNDQNKKGKITGPLRSFDKCSFLTELLFDGNALSGSIPTNFLKFENRTDALITVGLSDNQLTGTLPTTLGRFQSLNIDVTHNFITGIPDEFCDMGAWQSGLVETFGCDAILCSAKTFADDGRQTSEELACLPCSGGSDFLGQTTCDAAPNTLTELQILAILYSELEGNNWKVTDGWDKLDAILNENNLEDLQNTNQDYCSWHGVTCENQKITTLALEDNRLVGTVPSEIWQLSSLVDLNLKKNDITLGSDGFEGIDRATALETLHLGATQITSLKNLSASKSVLRLFFDGLLLADGTFTVELLQMTQLQAIRLSHAGMTGLIPTTVGTLTALTELNLYANSLSGKIPSEIGLLSNLVRLDLSESAFTGKFPNELLGLSKLQYLHIHQSDAGALSGALPSFSSLPAIKELSLDSNAFTGAIPNDFLTGVSDKSAPIKIGLSYNKISGKVPGSLDSFEDMTIDLEGNEITEIDASLCDNLQWMDGQVGALQEEGGCLAILCPTGQWAPGGKASSTSDLCQPCGGGQAPYMGTTQCGDEGGDGTERAILNELFKATGGRYWTMQANWTSDGVPICYRFGIECKAGETDQGVTRILLDNNGLKGDVPSSIFNLPSLEEVEFSNNAIDLSFEGIEQAASLITMKLESVSISSADGLDKAPPSLIELHLQFNQIGGPVPQQIMALTNLQHLLLSHNKFTGTVPTEFGSFVHLRQLHLGANELTGYIPTEVGGLVRLQHLDLEVNSLSGTIPEDALSQIKSLEVLQLGNQQGVKKLAGPLPSFSSNSLLTDIALEHNTLSGIIPSNFLQNVDAAANIRVLLQSNQLKGQVPTSLSRFQNLHIDLSDNQISDLSGTLCNIDGWMSGLIGELNTCNAILCPPGTTSASQTGRQTSLDDTCDQCPNGDTDAPYFGTLKCISSGTKSERKTLIDIYNALNGTNWIKQNNWKSEDKSVCTWYGITCDDNGAVSEINMVENNLEDLGSADAASLFFSLPHLTRLDIKSNAVKLDLTKIPTTSKLQILWLSGTGLEKVDGISHASDLRRLHLTDNDLKGTFPEELLKLTQLRSLYLSFNQFSGGLPEGISALSNLIEFYMYGNLISGELPGPAIGKLTALAEFIMPENFLTGTIPTEFNSMPKLEQFSLYDQGGDGFYGDVPNFSGSPMVWYFDVTNNAMSGTIPTDFLQSSIYKNATDGGLTIYFKNNLLTGSIPAGLDDFLELDIDISGNDITDIPPVLCDNGGWMQGRVADIQSCDAIACPPGTWNENGRQEVINEPCKSCEHETESIKNNWGNLYCDDFASEADVLRAIYDFAGGDDWTVKDNWYTNEPICSWAGITCLSGKDTDNEGILIIDLDDNNMIGTMPTEVFSLPRLSELLVNDNEDLVVPLDYMRNAKSLEIIKLSETRVPKVHGISWPKTIREIHITGIGLMGAFPPEILDLGETLEGLYIAFNAFSGPLPPRIGQLTMLTDFYAYDNAFSGTVPKEIGTMSNLQNMVLAENLISGPLPSEMSSLNSLQLFSCYRRDKPGRKLTGPLPSFNNNPSLTDLYLDHNDITGTIPKDFLAGASNADFVQLQHNVLSGEVPVGLDSIENLFLDLGGNRISGYPTDFCDNNGWMDGAMETVGCDSFLCPPGSSNSLGRANGTMICSQCSDLDAAKFYGAVSCDPPVDEKTMLIQFYQDAGGSEWYRRDGWAGGADFCSWFGVECAGGSVRHLRLGANNLVGELNPQIFSLPRLQTLWLYSNPLEITFENIESATQLADLRLDATRLQHFNQIQNAVSLTRLNVEFVGYSRKFPTELLELTNLRVLELGNNAMHGELPEDLWQLSHLQTLNLERNQFGGNLPTFEDLYALEQLRLGHNRFTGPVPPGFLDRHQDDAKVTVDISDNKINGLLPFTLLRFDKLTLYLKNNQISGYGGSQDEFCSKARWNDGSVREYGCDAIMCEPGTFSPIGRQRDEETKCVQCPGAKKYGTGTCGSVASGGFATMSVSLGAVVALLAAFIIM